MENGYVITNMKTRKFNILHHNVSSYSGLMGVDYLYRKWFYLSSEVGYMKIGGQETNKNLQIVDSADYKAYESWNYGQLNTTLRVKHDFDNLEVFLGVGPYLNILLGSDRFHSHLYANSGYKAKRLNFGSKMEIGLTENFHRIRVGLNGAYFLSLSPIAKSQYTSIVYKGYGIFLSLGYKLK